MNARGWLTKTRNTDGSVSTVGNFHDEWEAEKWADAWNESTGRMSAFVERAAVAATVTQIRTKASETFVCPCGSQWFSMHYRMDVDGRIIERSGVATCDGNCGRKHEVTK